MCLYLHYTLWLKAISNLSLVHLIKLRHRQTLMEVHGVYNVAGHIKQQHTRKHLQRRAAETSFCFQVLLH